GGGATSAARLAELDARLEEFAARTEGLDALPGLAARLDGLAGRVEDLARLRERVAGLSALDERVEALSALQARVAALAEAQGAARGALSGQAALRLGVEGLSVALRGSGPFAAELGLLQDLAASDALPVGAALERLLAPIAPHAEAGIPSRAALIAGFPEVARALRRAAPEGAEDDWLAGVLRRLSELVTVQRLGPEGRVVGAGADAVVARAQDQLEAGRLDGALTAIEALEGPAAEAARAWREDAAARLAARRALTGLARLLLDQRDAGGG
ncbi:MAG: mitofilin family membrane protein, partial [Kiloniellales bacterium]